jgi:hypothetical protein
MAAGAAIGMERSQAPLGRQRPVETGQWSGGVVPAPTEVPQHVPQPRHEGMMGKAVMGRK